MRTRLAILIPLLFLLASCQFGTATRPMEPHDQVRIAAQTHATLATTLTGLRKAGQIDEATWNEVVKPLDKAAADAILKAQARADAGDEFNARYYLTVYQDAMDRLQAIVSAKGGSK